MQRPKGIGMYKLIVFNVKCNVIWSHKPLAEVLRDTYNDIICCLNVIASPCCNTEGLLNIRHITCSRYLKMQGKWLSISAVLLWPVHLRWISFLGVFVFFQMWLLSLESTTVFLSLRNKNTTCDKAQSSWSSWNDVCYIVKRQNRLWGS